MPRNANSANENLSGLPDPDAVKSARIDMHKRIALEFVRRGEGTIAPQLAKEIGKDPKFIYRILKEWLDWARKEVKRERREAKRDENSRPSDHTASGGSLPDSSVAREPKSA